MADRYVGIVESRHDLFILYSSTGSLIGQTVQLEQLAHPCVAEPPRALELNTDVGSVIGVEDKGIAERVYAAQVIEIEYPLFTEAVKSLRSQTQRHR